MSRAPSWTVRDGADQAGRTAIVTGANTGIGWQTARVLCLKGARVVLACRDVAKGNAAAQRIRDDAGSAQVEVERLDLADLGSVFAFAARFSSATGRLDLLVNNAGVMAPPLSRTKQGFELQFGVNHLGHFALTARLLPLLLQGARSRLVVVSSGMERFGRIRLEDLNWERRRYCAWAAYSQSKLANMMFALELERRLTAAGRDVSVTAAHPGWTRTELQRTTKLVRFFNPLFSRPEQGALSIVRAAIDPGAQSGTYWGPSGLFELAGSPGPARRSARARNVNVSRRLFDLSEQLTGVSFAEAMGETATSLAESKRIRRTTC
jgi:NAD(P)-dependent dehydrogenase (short-subunit alcohol dehydrogenase family)